MQDSSDTELLSEFVRHESEEAFTALVERHIGLVYSVAMRQVADPHQAEDVTQAVFVLLARKAQTLSPKIILSGWLYRTAQLTAANQRRMETRRQNREQEAYMQSLNESDQNAWVRIASSLDAAMAVLGRQERDAVVLRFFEGKSLKEVGAALDATEDAAQKRVERGLKKMRGFFAKRGVTFSSVFLGDLLGAHAVQAAPPGLAKLVVSSGIAKGAIVGAPVTLLANSTLKAMTWLKVKTVAKVALAVILVAGTTTAVLQAGDYIKRGRFYLFKGDYYEAVANFNLALALDPQSVAARFSRGRASKLEGNFEQAVADYTKTIQEDPKAVAAYVNRGQIYNREGFPDRAIADFDQAIQLDSRRPIPYLDRGVAYVEKYDYAQAIADFRSAINLDPSFSPAYNNLALQLATCPDSSLRNGRRAVGYATKACELSGWNNLKQISTLAASYAESGDFTSAIKWENQILGSPQVTAKEASTAQARLALYQAHQPYHREETN